MRRSRVLWVSPSYGYGDDLMYFAPIFRAMTARMPGTAIAVRADFPVERYPDLPLVPMLPPGSRGEAAPGAAYLRISRGVPAPRTLLRLLAAPVESLITIEFTPVAVATLLIGAIRRRPAVLLIENHPRYRGGAAGGRAAAIKGLLARRAGAVLTSNAEAADWIADQLRVPRERILVGAYLTASPGEGDRPTRDQRVRRLLFVNSVTRRKGLAELLEALSRTRAVQDGTVLLDVVGDGDDLSRCVELASTLGLSAIVRFHGRLRYEQLAPHFAAADVVVNPSLGDYRSLVGFEALLTRTPVILSVHDGAAAELAPLADVVTVVDPADADSTAAALDVALDRCDAIAADAAAWQDVRDRYSFDAVAENVARAVDAARRR